MTGRSRATPLSGDTTLILRGLSKRFGDVVAVDAIDLTVGRGEFITLLGPSGSGKTTTLRMIAGFTKQDGGSIEIDGEDMSHVPPYRRDVGMVFQNYALFPHLTAAENIAFPLEMRNRPRAEIRERVSEALDLVHLPGLGARYPRQLSGGQQQRVALARAVVFRPRLLLMDEPLGALDKKLRESLQLEILRITRQLGATAIYVTHDQEEALVMSDRIAIFNGGRIEQLGTGADLYERPGSLFVAEFVGESNVLRGRFTRAVDGGWIEQDGWHARVGAAAAHRVDLADGAAAALIIRPERTTLIPTDGDVPTGHNVISATVTEALYLGSDRKYELVLGDGRSAVVRSPAANSETFAPGDAVKLAWKVDDGVLVGESSPA